jgi:DNA-binding GntR family transcriptional regulator
VRTDSIAYDLKSALLTGEFKPGAELIQTELAERYGVSRIPIRDALRELSEEGLVVIGTSGNARVIEPSRAEVAELFDIRVLLECDCVERAVANLDADALDKIDHLRRRGDVDARSTHWAASDWQFHHAIYQHAQRPRQLKMIESLRQTCQFLIIAYQTLPMKTTTWLSDHAALVARLKKRDAEGASRVLRRHIEGARDHLLERVK